VKRRIATEKETFSKRGELLRGKITLRVKEKNSKDTLEYGIVCRRNMGVEESLYLMSGII